MGADPGTQTRQDADNENPKHKTQTKIEGKIKDLKDVTGEKDVERIKVRAQLVHESQI